MEEIASRYPTGDVYVAWDNLNIHCGEVWQRFSERSSVSFATGTAARLIRSPGLSAAASRTIPSLPDGERAMPRRATQQDADGAAFMFRALGYPHLRARAVADHVLIETGAVENPTADIGLRLVSADEWRVELKLGACWQKTSNVGPRGNMVAAICDLFGQTTHRRK